MAERKAMASDVVRVAGVDVEVRAVYGLDTRHGVPVIDFEARIGGVVVRRSHQILAGDNKALDGDYDLDKVERDFEVERDRIATIAAGRHRAAGLFDQLAARRAAAAAPKE